MGMYVIITDNEHNVLDEGKWADSNNLNYTQDMLTIDEDGEVQIKVKRNQLKEVTKNMQSNNHIIGEVMDQWFVTEVIVKLDW